MIIGELQRLSNTFISYHLLYLFVDSTTTTATTETIKMLSNIIAGQQAYITNLHSQILQMNMQLFQMSSKLTSNKFQDIPPPFSPTIQYPFGGPLPTWSSTTEEIINNLFHNKAMNKMFGNNNDDKNQ